MAFADGDVLSASQLNDLVTRVNALEDQRIGVNLGFAEAELTSTVTDLYYQVVHEYDWLHVRFHEDDDTVSLRIYYDATEVYASGGIGGDVTVNLDLSGFSLVVGTEYRVRIRWGGAAGKNVQVKYMVEAEEEL